MSREIEDRLRAALSAKADRISEGDLRPAQLPESSVGPARAGRQGRRWRRTLPWLAPVLAAAAAVIVFVGVADRSPGRHTSSNSSAAGSASSSPSPPVTTPTGAESPASSGADAGPLADAASQQASGLTVPRGTKSSLKLLPSAVLGTTSYWPAGNTRGFGESHPTELSTSGDLSGIVLGITWQDWGASTATGAGRTYLPKPGGGYYPGTVPIQLQATKLGRCGSELGYQQLYYRTPTSPGGAIDGPWRLWADADNLCQSR